MNHSLLESVGLSGIELVRLEGAANSAATVNNYNIWHTNYGDIYYLPYVYEYIYKWEFLLWNPTRIHALFNEYWHLSFAIVLLYIIAIFGLQKIMANKQPFVLRRPLILWNFLLAVFSALGTWRFTYEFIFAVNRSLQVCITF
jgi:hypothetical protein